MANLIEMHGEVEDIFKAQKPSARLLDLDLKSLNRVDPFFRYEVVRDGQLLYGDPTDYEDYKAYAFRAFEDSKDLRELERVLIEKSRRHFKKYVK